MKRFRILLVLFLVASSLGLLWSCRQAGRTGHRDREAGSKLRTDAARLPTPTLSFPTRPSPGPDQPAPRPGKPCPADRLADAWREGAAADDPGRREIAELLGRIGVPVELTVEVGNAAWEQQDLLRLVAAHPGFPPRRSSMALPHFRSIADSPWERLGTPTSTKFGPNS